MDRKAALQAFLNGTLARRRDRYLGFISKTKTQSKFLATIEHTLEGDFDRTKQVAALPSGNSPIPGYRFAPPADFGSAVNDLREVCRSTDDSFLVVSRDGRLGVHGPEMDIDDRAIYAIAKASNKRTR